MKENSPNFEIKFLSSHLLQNVEFFYYIENHRIFPWGK